MFEGLPPRRDARIYLEDEDPVPPRWLIGTLLVLSMFGGLLAGAVYALVRGRP